MTETNGRKIFFSQQKSISLYYISALLRNNYARWHCLKSLLSIFVTIFQQQQQICWTCFVYLNGYQKAQLYSIFSHPVYFTISEMPMLNHEKRTTLYIAIYIQHIQPKCFLFCFVILFMLKIEENEQKCFVSKSS